jgi:hypothetical protein
MYHDTLLEQVVKKNPSYKPLIPLSLHTRFTRAWIDKTDIYKWASRTLEVIKYTELMIEMGLRRRFSEKARWRGIILLEVVKCVPSRIVITFADLKQGCSPYPSSPNHKTASGHTDGPRTRL